LQNTDLNIIIEGCTKNEIHNQRKLYELCYTDMIKICFRYAKDADGAGTIFNDAMLKVFKNIGDYKEQGKLFGWIKTILVNCCIDYCKKELAFKNKISQNAEMDINIQPEVLNNVSNKEIQIFLKRLPVATAIVFNMYVYEGFTHKQIGHILGISDGTSKWHLSEAKQSLKNKLEKLIEIEF
jgi:RNA polymerase sigma-70 factor, ECF subfamily